MVFAKINPKTSAFVRSLLLPIFSLVLLFWWWHIFASGELRQYSSGHQQGAAESFARLGATIDTTDNEGRTPLIIAASYGNVELTCFLLNRGANANAHDKDGNTPLIEAARQSPIGEARSWEDFSTTAGVLLAYGAEPEVSNKSGETAQSLAQKHGDKQLLTLIKRSQSQ